MGMQSRLEQISAEQLAAYVRDPRTAYESFLARLADPEAIVSEMLEHLGEFPEKELSEMITRMQVMAESPVLPAEVKKQIVLQVEQYQSLMKRRKGPQPVIAAVEQPKRFSLEKDWHMLHYALTGTAAPGDTWISKCILGGRELPDVDGMMGYGPLRYLQAEEVRKISEELARVDPQTLLSRLDKDDAEEKRIYLAHTLDDLHDWDYLPQLFTQFRDFYSDAAQHGNAMLLSIT